MYWGIPAYTIDTNIFRIRGDEIPTNVDPSAAISRHKSRQHDNPNIDMNINTKRIHTYVPVMTIENTHTHTNTCLHPKSEPSRTRKSRQRHTHAITNHSEETKSQAKTQITIHANHARSHARTDSLSAHMLVALNRRVYGTPNHGGGGFRAFAVIALRPNTTRLLLLDENTLHVFLILAPPPPSPPPLPSFPFPNPTTLFSAVLMGALSP